MRRVTVMLVLVLAGMCLGGPTLNLQSTPVIDLTGNKDSRLGPGEVIWGPKVCPGMPDSAGLYGVTYNTNDNLIYTTYFSGATIYKYSSDNALTAQGTIPAPQDSCTDIDYIAYADAFWLVCNPEKVVYKISPTGSVLGQFPVSFAEYPCGITENEADHKVYLSDRRLATNMRSRIFVLDTVGTVLETIIHPLQSNFGARCLALDGRSPTNPPSLLNIYTWFDPSGDTLDSCGMYELDRIGHTVLGGCLFSSVLGNIRGIEFDPRDGSYWIASLWDHRYNNVIFKAMGFNYTSGVAGPKPGLPGAVERVVVRALPSPFTGSTNLSVRLPSAGCVDLEVYDNNGRVVRTLASGTAVGTRALFPWDGRNEKGRTVAPGIYFYHVKSATAEAWGKVVLSR